MRTFWLSFADSNRPAGQRFLGVALVDVSDEEAALMVDEVRQRFPNARVGAEWIAAATRKAWSWGCNPGGEIGCAELPPEAYGDVPRNRLLTRAELTHYGCEFGEIA